MLFLTTTSSTVCSLFVAMVQVWMLTGDKLETATSIALSSRLISRTQTIFTFKQASPMQSLVVSVCGQVVINSALAV